MAWRIDECVVRGEIDNRTRGRVTGRLWLLGRETPIELDLAGNAWRDLAGRRLEFVNPRPKPMPSPLAHFVTEQTGVIGDCTASRKVKVPEVSRDERMELYRQRKPFPWHWGNSLYLEWFSARNGRVVIESAEFQLTVSSEAAWEMLPEEEEQQRRANGEAMDGFMSRLADAVPPQPPAPATEDAGFDDEKPMTEEEAERMQADSDRLADRIQARLDREGPDADYEKILDEELERRARERGEKPLTPEEEAQRAEWIDEVNRDAEEALANPDPEIEAELETKHPVAERASELTLRLMGDAEDRNWIPDEASDEHPVAELVSCSMSASAKLAGALNGQTWPPPVDFCASNLVRLKRARSYIDDALLAADTCAEQHLTEPAWLAEAQRELHELAQACDTLIAELRALLERGFD